MSAIPVPSFEQGREVLEFVTACARLGVWQWDLVSGALRLDTETCDTCGLPVDLQADHFIGQAIHQDDREALRDSLARALCTPEPLLISLRLLDRHGATHLREARIKVIRNAAGRALQGLIVTRVPQTQPDRAEELARRAEAERALVERLSVATQAAGIYVWEFDWVKLVIAWDENRLAERTAKRHFGYEFGNDLFRWVHPEDRDVGRTTMRAALADGASDASFRYRLLLADGSIRHIQAYARTYADVTGNPLRSLGVSWDVTREVEDAAQLAQHTAELRDAQRRLERASLSIQEGHWEIDWIAQRHWASSSYYALLGYGPDEVRFDSYDKLDAVVHPDDRLAVHEATDRHITQGTPLYEVELRIALKDGRYRWFRLRGTAERDEHGQLVRMAGSIHDIQKQKTAEDALREAQARFDRAVKGTQDGLWEADTAQGHMWLSPRAQELLGYEPGELPAHLSVLRDRIHPEQLAVSDEALQNCLLHALNVDRELPLQMKSGEYRWFRVRATPDVGPDGTVRRMAGSLQDVTEARAGREALVQASEAAQAANRSKSAFLANMSHEIRTPMNGIIGMTSLLLDTALERSQREYAETIRSSADSLLTIINDILDFSKIEAGRLDIESIPMDLHDCVEDIGATLAFQAAAKELELIISVHPEVPTHVRGDPQRIRQCLVNLIGNAIKFTKVGEISIDVTVTGRQGPTSRVRFAVRDTGIGLSSESTRTLFQPFVQADVSTTRNFGGTGLGLSIVRRLIELMGGEVGLESELGKGSTFWFVLPMQETAASAEPSDPDGRGQRLLIVDDNETNRRVLATNLAHAGYDVTLASSGREALVTMQLALGARRPFDLVLSDFQMPDMDGAALGETINADPALARSRIVLLTSVDDHGDLERFAALGFAGYLTKPIRGRQLRACLNRVLAREAAEWHVHSHPIVTSASVAARGAPKPFSGRVLLVEDNVVNQKVGQKFLERLGCEVRIAAHGAEGLQLWREEAFDIVLMDIQMPVMDGYTATRQIRDLEHRREHRTPIIALTADAMSGQLERCLQAGMDALLTKPLNPEHLRDTLERYGLGMSEMTLQEAAVGQLLTSRAPDRGGIDLRGFANLIGQDPQFAHGLVSEFAASSRQILSAMRDCLAADNRSELAAQAHQLKGASANLHARGLAAACQALELEVKQASAVHLSAQIERLAGQVSELCARLEEHIATAQAAPSGQ